MIKPVLITNEEFFRRTFKKPTWFANHLIDKFSLTVVEEIDHEVVPDGGWYGNGGACVRECTEGQGGNPDPIAVKQEKSREVVQVRRPMDRCLGSDGRGCSRHAGRQSRHFQGKVHA